MSTHSPQRDPEELSQEEFDRLLDWLDPDRNKAGARYEWIRKRLIKIFVCRGSVIPEELADRVINRVARKLEEIRPTYVGNRAHYFSAVAGNIFLESLRKEKAPTIGMPAPALPSEDDERLRQCFERCVAILSGSNRDLVLSYYREEKKAKIDHRKDLAAKLGLGLNALSIRACRTRATLQECVERCATNENF